MEPFFLEVGRLAEHPYRAILGYPRASDGEISERVRELVGIGVESVSFAGGVRINGLDVLGKGHVGLVVLAQTVTGQAALKVRRTDSPRADMSSEAGFMRGANDVGVGPRLYRYSRNFVLMEYLQGATIREWIYGLGEDGGDAARLKGVIRAVLQDCFRLDRAGLDHGELVNISKHVIVGEEKATIIDFESSSTNRRVANVTSAAQSMYVGTGLAAQVARIYDAPAAPAVIESLRTYKRSGTKKSFDALLGVLRV